jgi:hypothetical protein
MQEQDYIERSTLVGQGLQLCADLEIIHTGRALTYATTHSSRYTPEELTHDYIAESFLRDHYPGYKSHSTFEVGICPEDVLKHLRLVAARHLCCEHVLELGEAHMAEGAWKRAGKTYKECLIQFDRNYEEGVLYEHTVRIMCIVESILLAESFVDYLEEHLTGQLPVHMEAYLEQQKRLKLVPSYPSLQQLANNYKPHANERRWQQSALYIEARDGVYDWGGLRGLLHKPPSRKHFMQLIMHLKKGYHHPTLESEVLPYVKSFTQKWPPSVCLTGMSLEKYPLLYPLVQIHKIHDTASMRQWQRDPSQYKYAIIAHPGMTQSMKSEWFHAACCNIKALLCQIPTNRPIHDIQLMSQNPKLPLFFDKEIYVKWHKGMKLMGYREFLSHVDDLHDSALQGKDT